MASNFLFKKLRIPLLFFISLASAYFNEGLAQEGGATCNCKEYIYLNEPALGAVLKFEINAGVPLTEVVGTNGGTPPNQHWYPGLGATQMNAPHGLATDLNGNLYVGASPYPVSQIRKLNCDGALAPAGPTTINSQFILTNMFSIGNTIYTTRTGGPAAYNSCTGELIGTMCLNDENGNPIPIGDVNAFPNWGLSYNPVTEMVYVTERETGSNVWAFSRAQLEAGILGGPCIDPLITEGTNPTVNPGDNYLPNTVEELWGITSDNAGNIYTVVSPLYGGTLNHILKYDAFGKYVSKSPSATTGSAFGASIGIVWSETTNRLYMSNNTDDPAIDCISAFDAVTMQYLGTAAPNPGLPSNNTAKTIVILKECCPVNLPATFEKQICGGVGDKFYLNKEAFSNCNGTVCGSSWNPTSISGMTFDPCDNSVTITGEGCGVFELAIGAVTSTNCGPQSATFTICNFLPPVAGDDVEICLPKTKLKLKEALAGTEWVAAASGNPAAATINSSTGAITGLTAIGTYTFSLRTIANPTCKDDVIITVSSSTPYVLCNDGSTSVTATAEPGLTQIVWFNAAGTQVGTGSSLIITSNLAGLADGDEWFYYTAKDASDCDVELCCPVVIKTEDCCPTPNCLGVTVIKN